MWHDVMGEDINVIWCDGRGYLCGMMWWERIFMWYDVMGEGIYVIWYDGRGYLCYMMWWERIFMWCDVMGEDIYVIWCDGRGYLCDMMWWEKIFMWYDVMGEDIYWLLLGSQQVAVVGRLAQKEERETALYTKGERVHKTIKENNAKKNRIRKI